MFNRTRDAKPDSDRLCSTSAVEANVELPTSQPLERNKSIPNQSTATTSHKTPLPSSTSSTITQPNQVAATALHQHYLNYYSNKIPKEEIKSQRVRNHSLLSQQQQLSSGRDLQKQNLSNILSHQRSHVSTSGRHSIYQTPTTSQHHRQQQPSQNALSTAMTDNQLLPGSSSSSNQQTRDEAPSQQIPLTSTHHRQLGMNSMTHQRTHPARAVTLSSSYPSRLKDADMPLNGNLSQSFKDYHHHQNSDNLVQQQLDPPSEEIETATIREEIEDTDLDCVKDSELAELSSLEKNLPVELSFLIRQQAYCMARMNYLDRQIRELRESAQVQIDSSTPQVSSTSIVNQSHQYHHNSRFVPSNVHHLQQQQPQYHNHNHQQYLQQQQQATTLAHTKNGNFILSDDSGGEYSRATVSDDDELSSLLDQIVKSVRPETRPNGSASGSLKSHQKTQLATTNYSAIIGNQQSNQPQQYAIVNSSQLHPQQAVPIFVMSSPFAVAHPAPSISSNILPGVHFQPEPRYNQYYEGFCYPNFNNNASAGQMVANMTSSPMNQGHQQQQLQQHQQLQPTGLISRSQQFDTSISAIEQLVNQRERRQIKAHLRSADNWLKMRSTGLSNLPNESSFDSLRKTNGLTNQTGPSANELDPSIDKITSSPGGRANNMPTSSSLSANTMATVGNNCGVDKESNVHQRS